MILEEKEHFIEIDIKLSNGTLIGTAEIEPNEKILERFVIFEPYQNKGYGQQVLFDLIDNYGIQKLWVRSDNEKAIHIYEKVGFKKTKETMFEMCRVQNKTKSNHTRALKSDPYTDIISREEAITVLRADSSFICPSDKSQAIIDIASLQPATSEKPKGKWELTDDKQSYCCSCCKNHWISAIEHLYIWKYCPNCGADMRVGE